MTRLVYVLPGVLAETVALPWRAMAREALAGFAVEEARGDRHIHLTVVCVTDDSAGGGWANELVAPDADPLPLLVVECAHSDVPFYLSEIEAPLAARASAICIDTRGSGAAF
jgi:hypothetical protein